MSFKKLFGLSTLTAAVFLGACTAAPNRDLGIRYEQMLRKFGLTPVYPPREELRVGDVFFVSYDQSGKNKNEERFNVWVGTLDSLRRHANSYMQSRINYTDTGDSQNVFVTTGKQDDFSNGSVDVNQGARSSLPLVTFPTITGAATTAGAFGSFGFLRSFGLSVGRSETVSIDFTDTRAFGIPIGGVAALGKFEQEYLDKICPQNKNFLTSAKRMATARGIDPTEMCQNGRKCNLTVVTRTYTTRKIDYRYTSARIARLAASRTGGLAGETTLPATSNIDLNITISDDTSAEGLAKIAAALQPNVTNPDTKAEFEGLSFSGFQGNTLKFDRTLQKPVAIAYDALTYDLNGDEMSCGLKIEPAKK